MTNLDASEDSAIEFLNSLRDVSTEQAEALLENIEIEQLTLHLKAIETMLWEGRNDKMSSDELISLNFVYILISLHKFEKSSKFGLSNHVFMILTAFCWNTKQRKILIKTSFGEVLHEILSKQNEKEILSLEILRKVQSTNLILHFFPALPPSDCYEDEYFLSKKNIVKVGYTFDSDDKESRQDLVSMLNVIFQSVYEYCQRANSEVYCHFVLLKLVYWANAFDVLTTLVDINKLIDFIKKLLQSDKYSKFGLAFVHTLISKYLELFRREKIHEILDNVTMIMNAHSVADPTSNKWVAKIHQILAASDDSMVKMFLYCVKDESFSSTIHLRAELVRAMLEFLLPYLKERTNDLNAHYSQLTTFMRVSLNLPKDDGYHVKPISVPEDGIETFRSLVRFALRTHDAFLKEGDRIFDNFNHETTLRPQFLKEFSLGLYQSPFLNKILDPAQWPQEPKQIVDQSLMLLSIFHEVNENWGVLFCSLTSEPLIERSCFISKQLTLKLINMLDKKLISHRLKPSKPWLSHVTKYYFLVPFLIRQQLFEFSIHFNPNDRLENVFTVPRKNTLEFVTQNIDKMMDFKESIWKLEFENEVGSGRGPAKEFFAEFSRDCERYDPEIWIGEPTMDSNGVAYSHSPCGLFFSPMPFHFLESELKLEAMGFIMGKSLSDGYIMDMNLSKAFFKCMKGCSPNVQALTLIDIKDIMPSFYEFVVKLVDALRMKNAIKNDESLSADESSKMISEITIDGVSFDELCINFTLPGYAEIEMKEGGYDTILTIDNLEEYLHLLTCCLLYKGPQQRIETFKRQLSELIPTERLEMFYPEEIDQLICGIKREQWSVSYLNEKCILEDDLTVDSPVVQYLFEVISSFSAKEQRQFLQFVTGTPRLPRGGLESLMPSLSIECETFYEDPDMRLPYSRTCFNTLIIPHYSSKDALREKLLLAITEGVDSFQFA